MSKYNVKGIKYFMVSNITLYLLLQDNIYIHPIFECLGVQRTVLHLNFNKIYQCFNVEYIKQDEIEKSKG